MCTGEKSVTIRIKVAGQELLAMLDTRVTPSVIDRGTIDHLGLTEHVVLRSSRVFGLCKRPVEVQGVIQIHVTVGDQHIQTEFQVLDCDESILLLERKFMSKFGLVTFDWKGGRIRMGEKWTPIATVSGGTPFFCAQTAGRDTRIAIIQPPLGEFDISDNLSPEQHRQLSQLVHKNEDLFAVDPKSPSTTDMCKQAIETGDEAPIQ